MYNLATALEINEKLKAANNQKEPEVIIFDHESRHNKLSRDIRAR
jgi:hypothetical protein